MAKIEKTTWGEDLVGQGVITKDQFQKAQEEGKRTGSSFKKSLVQLGYMTEEGIVIFLSSYLHIPYVDLSTYLVKPEVVKLVPEAIARKHRLIPIFKIGGTLTIAMVDPLNYQAIDEVRLKCRQDIKPAITTEASVQQALEQYYGTRGSIEQIVKDIDKKGLPRKESEAAEDPPIVKLVNLLVMQAIHSGASDIHIEPDKESLRTRIRVDGILHEVPSAPKSLASAIISRIKILSDMNIAERRAPQDGRFQIKIEKREVDIRVSIIPTIYGEKAVLRLLDTGSVLLGLEDIGFAKELLKDYQEMIRQPHGILLVTGPTGSGKSTTLYASLNKINSKEKNIVTIEDPVEYRLNLVQQMQVHAKAGVTFAKGLRSILRQDPDIIMVGEIRDLETAEIAIQAALTGHLVFSTLHTNDAPSAFTRLIDMGVEPFLISSSLTGVLAQRLVRKLCKDCKEVHKPSAEVLKDLGLDPNASFFKAKGCRKCMETGYKGRISIFELLVPDEEIRSLVSAKVSSDKIRKAATSKGMKGLRESGLEKAAQGITTIEEVLRATQAEA